MTQFKELIRLLAESQVELIIVGGAAATAHGSARLTEDLDLVYRRIPENLRRLVRVLAPYKPYQRGAPPNLPFRWEERTLQSGLNFTLRTSLGPLDLLGEITGCNYEDLQRYCVRLQVFGVECLFLGLERLIQVKRATGRPRDFEAIRGVRGNPRRTRTE